MHTNRAWHALTDGVIQSHTEAEPMQRNLSNYLLFMQFHFSSEVKSHFFFADFHFQTFSCLFFIYDESLCPVMWGHKPKVGAQQNIFRQVICASIIPPLANCCRIFMFLICENVQKSKKKLKSYNQNKAIRYSRPTVQI